MAADSALVGLARSRLSISENTADRDKWIERALCLAAVALAFVIYNRTLTPSLSYDSPDSNELVAVAYQLGLAHPSGYPLYTWLAKLFTYLPVGDIAHRVNLLSAVLGAGGVGLLYLIARRLGMGRAVSLFAALLFAFSRTFWSQAVIAEVYAPNVFMLGLSLFLLLRWGQLVESGQEARTGRAFIAFAFVFGLSLGTHISNLAFAPAFAVYALGARGRRFWRSREVALGAAAFVLACLQFLWVPWRGADLIQSLVGTDPLAAMMAVYKYTLGAFDGLRFAFPVSALPGRVLFYLDLLRQNVSGPGVLAGSVGMVAMAARRKRVFVLLFLMYLAHVAFLLEYRIVDLAVFLIPSYFLFALFAGFGLYVAVEAVRRLASAVGRRSGAWTPRWSGGAASLALALAVVVPIGGQLRANFEVNDRSHDTAVNDFYRTVYAWLPEGSQVWTRGAVLGYDTYYYQLVYGARPDLKLPMLTVTAGRSPAPAQPGEHAFATVRPGLSGPYMPPLPPAAEAWYVPLLAAPALDGQAMAQRELVLYSISATPPALAADPLTIASDGKGATLAPGLDLAGYQVEPRSVQRGQTVDIKYYWRAATAGDHTVRTHLSGPANWTESHELGFGNLARYVAEQHAGSDTIVEEQYQLLVPLGTPPGVYTFQVGASEGNQRAASGPKTTQYVDAGKIEVH